MVRGYLFIIVAVLLSVVQGCTSSRFLSYESSKTSIKKSSQKNQLVLPVWSEKSIIQLEEACSVAKNLNIIKAVQILGACNELLSRVKLRGLQQDIRLDGYNQSLQFLVIILLESKTNQIIRFPDLGLTLKLSASISSKAVLFLNSFIKPIDKRLAFKTFGELGVAGVIATPNNQVGSNVFYPLEGIFRPITFGHLTRKGDHVELTIDLHIMDESKSIALEKESYSLTYAPGAAFLMLLEHANIDKLGWTGLINPAKAESRRGVFSIEPISNSKIPILMIHGLNSDPLI